MPSDHPRTPESPSNTSYNDFSKQVTSPRPTHSLPTPAHSINGSMSSMGSEMAGDEVSSKRKREIGDQGDRDQKKIHVEDSRLRIEDLHVDVGKKYLLCKTPHPPAAVDVRQDLYARFSLQEIAKSVARTLPDGSKGVKLRKTYKNHMKDHGLSGQFDSVKKELENPDTLWAMMIAQPDEWDIEYTRGKEIEYGLSDSIQQLMGKAFAMARGPVPKAAWNDSVLGEINNPGPTEPVRPVQNGAKLQHPQNSSAPRSKSGDIPRPKRNVKKRTYGDSSYEGYGEGYVDDDTQETGYETGEGDDRGGPSRKRPKKSAQSPQGGPRRQDSYGPGMVGA